ncbi:hypothetical protein BJX68DRAFT_152646 [Aspergillus pseudodeflectus]|uniref:Protein kinase domain-containing protein n=1 Tax=Aspergillus pseudodeflectus TaxID=176178 RepID=A0ABR4JVF6_9EURO
MDIVGLAFATFGFVEGLVRTYDKVSTIITDAKQFDSDRSKLIAKLTTEKAVTLQLRDLLFARVPNAQDPSFFDQLDRSAQLSIHRVFEGYAGTISNYLPLEQRVLGSETTVSGHELLSEDMKRLQIEALNATLLPDSKPKNKEVLKSKTSILRWIFKDKARLTNFYMEFEMWNDKAIRLIEVHLLTHQSRLSLMDSHIGRPEVQKLGIRDAIKASSRATQPQLPQISAEISDFEKPWSALQNQSAIGDHSTLKLGRYDNNVVVVDSRKRDAGLTETQRTTVTRRLNQLCSILENLHNMEPTVPQCVAWMQWVDKSETSLLYHIPPTLSPRPFSLLDCLPKRSSTTGPSLDERLQIAYQLAAVLDRLHTVNWVHGSIRSDNILFYEPKSPPDDESDSTHILPAQWFLYGFDYARPIDATSSFNTDTNLARNIYRHPQRWGVPTESFGPIHDIYALGVVLLELGMWRKAGSMVNVVSSTSSNAAFEVQKALVKRAKEHLGFGVGEAFQEVVLRCLQGRFDAGKGNGEGRVELARQFRERVVDELRLFAFPRLGASQKISAGSLAQIESESEDC